ncbi:MULTISPECIES: type VI secretion system-associated protein TagO [Pantoea]|uniref:type VI secretion system-associated protein TagO n=1 Tax=Pantoea TaxID=53335 RepID=UPI0009E3082D|nr:MULTISPECIES: type VI secretion system-associated protein TagO [Pantoea]UBB12341.1 type VI secretion protein [Pantoea eucrina]
MKYLFAVLLAASFSTMANDELQNEGNWFFKSQVNKMTDATDVVAINGSKDVYTKRGLERNTSLVLRCNENQTDAYLSVYDYLGSGSPRITIRYDGGKPKKSIWQGGERGNSAFAPNAVSFIKELMKHKTAVIGFEPYGSTMQAVEFDLSGVDVMAKKIAEACNWKL